MRQILMGIIVNKERATLPEIVEAMKKINLERGLERENVYRHLEILVETGLIGKQYDQSQKKLYYLPKVKSIKIEFTHNGIEVFIESMEVD